MGIREFLHKPINKNDSMRLCFFIILLLSNEVLIMGA